MAEKTQKNFITALGRRKESVARLRLYTLVSANLMYAQE